MCLPKTPNIKMPDPVQEAKQPDSDALRTRMRNNRSAMAGPNLLTGPSGVAAGAAPTARVSLLGM